MRSSWAARVDGAHVGVLVERLADPQQLDPAPQPLQQLVGDPLLHQQPRAGAADVALVEEDAVDDALDRLVEGGVVEHHVGALAAELQRQPSAGPRELAPDGAPHAGGAGERHLVEPRVARQRLAGRPRAGDDVDHARREPRLGDQLRQQQRGERRGLRRLQHHRVPAGEGRRDLPGRHQQREVPGDDLPDHAERPGVMPGTAYSSLSAQPAWWKRCAAASGTSMSRDSRIGLPPSIDSSTANSRERSCSRRARRKRYLPRARPGRSRQCPRRRGARRRRRRRRPRRRLGDVGQVLAGGGLDGGERSRRPRPRARRRRSRGRTLGRIATMSRPSRRGDVVGERLREVGGGVPRVWGSSLRSISPPGGRSVRA